jgi:glycosyltransferase involved in cell wall biosynthesis
MSDISVVICAYTESRWNELVDAVASMRSQTLSPLEIIVVIDHNPALFERARAAFPDVIVIENKEKRGLSGARNSGIAVVQGDKIAFMDEDATAAPDWLAQLEAGYQDPAVLGVGGTIEPVWLDGRPAWFPKEFDWVVGCTYYGMPVTAQPVRNLIGCNMSFKREVFSAVGGFRVGIGRIGVRPVGCEETELCIRVNQRWPNSKLLYDPAARVRHLVPPQRGTWHYFRSRCYSEGLSKALVAQFVGSKDGLASERTYTLRTLPQGVVRNVLHAFRRDFNGPRRAAAIIAGLGFTTVGYLKGKFSQRELAPGAGRPESEVALEVPLP